MQQRRFFLITFVSSIAIRNLVKNIITGYDLGCIFELGKIRHFESELVWFGFLLWTCNKLARRQNQFYSLKSTRKFLAGITIPQCRFCLLIRINRSNVLPETDRAWKFVGHISSVYKTFNQENCKRTLPRYTKILRDAYNFLLIQVFQGHLRNQHHEGKILMTRTFVVSI